jgi:hypothetical protein
MLFAEFAIFFRLELFRMGLFVLGGVVVAATALLTRQVNNISHKMLSLLKKGGGAARKITR